MWGLFIGVAIGILQVLAAGKLARMIIIEKTAKLLGVALLILKFAAIILILYFISLISIAHLVWAAGGILLGLTAASVYLLKRRRRPCKK